MEECGNDVYMWDSLVVLGCYGEYWFNGFLCNYEIDLVLMLGCCGESMLFFVGKFRGDLVRVVGGFLGELLFSFCLVRVVEDFGDVVEVCDIWFLYWFIWFDRGGDCENFEKGFWFVVVGC